MLQYSIPKKSHQLNTTLVLKSILKAPETIQFIDKILQAFVEYIYVMFSSHPINPINAKKTSHQIFRHMHKVLNEVYLQNFLHGWTVNREMNLMTYLIYDLQQ